MAGRKYSGRYTSRSKDGIQLGVEFDFTLLKQLKERVKAVNNRHIEYGWLSPKMHPTARIPMPILARMQEYGVDNKGTYIPARRYFQQARIKIRKDFKKQSGEYIKDVLTTGSEDKLKTIGMGTKVSFEASVKMQNFRKLHEMTIQKKGHGFQWEETGQMMSAFTFKVLQTSIDKRGRS